MSERKNELGKKQMSGAVFVDEARDHLSSLVRAEASGPGDWIPAMQRVARRIRVPYAKLWALRYRPPKDVGASVLFALSAAHEAMRERQLQALEREVARDKAAGFGPDHWSEAEAVVAAARSEEGKV